MSRSFKRYSIYKGNDKYYKRAYNKKIRRIEDIPNGRAYRKLNCSYNISDYQDGFYSYNDYRQWCEKQGIDEEDEDALKVWFIFHIK